MCCASRGRLLLLSNRREEERVREAAASVETLSGL
jgi:hypothetical protein